MSRSGRNEIVIRTAACQSAFLTQFRVHPIMPDYLENRLFLIEFAPGDGLEGAATASALNDFYLGRLRTCRTAERDHRHQQ